MLVTQQHGFRKEIYTENAALRLTKSVFKTIYQEMNVGGIFCDWAKAFDCVHHGSLLPKLHVYSI